MNSKLSSLARHQAAIGRSMLKALHELQRLQAACAGAEVPLPVAVDISGPYGG